MSDPKSWLSGPGPWAFVPEGALLHRDAGLIVLSDLHLGYEDARSLKGDYLPIRSTDEALSRLRRLIRASGAKTVVVAGDVVESAIASSRRSDRIGEFRRGLEAMRVDPVFLRGNHDAGCRPIDLDSLIIDGWLIRHGHDEPPPGAAELKGEILGHSHPVLRWNGHTFRAFLSSSGQILLPAFACDAAGADVLDSRAFPDRVWADHECLVCRSDAVLSFGLLHRLRSKLARK